jgi:hypothetical protein
LPWTLANTFPLPNCKLDDHASSRGMRAGQKGAVKGSQPSTIPSLAQTSHLGLSIGTARGESHSDFCRAHSMLITPVRLLGKKRLAVLTILVTSLQLTSGKTWCSGSEEQAGAGPGCPGVCGVLQHSCLIKMGWISFHLGSTSGILLKASEA